MKKVAELSGRDLDLWVSHAEAIEAFSDGRKVYNMDDEMRHYHPTEDWSIAGPIIEREHILCGMAPSGEWAAFRNTAITGEALAPRHYGKNYLEAAMRCYVAIKFGDEVDENTCQ